MIVPFLEILSIIFNLCIFSFIMIKIFKGRRHSVYIVYLVYFIFFILPLILDLFIGIPDYSRFPGFYYSANDINTRIIYAIYSIFAPIIMLKIGINKKGYKNNLNISTLYKYRSFIYILIFSPILIFLFSPDKYSYLNYAAATKGLLDKEGLKFHNYLALSTRISVISIALLMYIKKKNNFLTLVLLLPILFFDIWVFGKRSIVALALVSVLFVVWKKKLFSNSIIIIGCFFSLLLLLLFSVNYQNNIRDYGDKEFSEKYLNYRIDYGRDDVTRLTIYNEINEESSILEYRGQSILFYLLIYIPREVWPEKPYPYAQYVTSALFMTEPKLWGWGMTTSILEETIANFGWLGMFIGPAIIGYIVRRGDNSINEAFTLISLFLSILLLVVHLTPIYFIFLIWLFLLFIDRKKRRNYILMNLYANSEQKLRN